MSDQPSPNSVLTIRTTSDTAQLAPVRKQIEAFCVEQGMPDRAAGEVGLCVNEAVANVIRHAYRGRKDQPIELTAQARDAAVIISIRDWGTGLQPGPLPDHKQDPLNPGGLGLICLGRLMDKVTFTPQSKGMLLEMFRSIRSA
jgi:serine/threonine-protein kinase RsbW